MKVKFVFCLLPPLHHWLILWGLFIDFFSRDSVVRCCFPFPFFLLCVFVDAVSFSLNLAHFFSLSLTRYLSLLLLFNFIFWPLALFPSPPPISLNSYHQTVERALVCVCVNFFKITMMCVLFSNSFLFKHGPSVQLAFGDGAATAHFAAARAASARRRSEASRSGRCNDGGRRTSTTGSGGSVECLAAGPSRTAATTTRTRRKCCSSIRTSRNAAVAYRSVSPVGTVVCHNRTGIFHLWILFLNFVLKIIEF